MNKLSSLLTVLVGLHFSVADNSGFAVSLGPCSNVPEVDWTESIKDRLRQIPNNLTLPSFVVEESFAGIDIGLPQLSGLGSLWAYKPYHTYCVEKDTFLETTAFASEPLVISIDWKSCAGSSGHFGVKVSTSQLRLVFKAAPTSDDPDHVELFKMYPDSLEDAQVFLFGAAEPIISFVKFANILSKTIIEQFWSYFLRLDPQIITKHHPSA
uniref:Metastriate one of each protein family n=1 Tax=Rhipicephalus zambeziensis TaxID=60191 RepID=A0A224YCV0_9ACAR